MSELDSFVTVIVPVYNVERYLHKCIDSIIGQSYKCLEIVLVDDGSNDRSGAICDEYQQLDQRIKVVHQKNQGLSMARNTGIEHASGEWIYFIDSDDWIKSEMIETLIHAANDANAEIAACKSLDVREDGSVVADRTSSADITIYEGENKITNLADGESSIRFEVWNKLWKRSLIGMCRFIQGQVSEDIHFDRILFLQAKRIVLADAYLHYYRIQRPGNTNSSFRVGRMCIFNAYAQWIEDLKSIEYLSAVQIVAFFACDSAAGLYYSAIKAKQEQQIIAELKKQFHVFYPHISATELCPMRLKLFNLSPALYCLASQAVKSKRLIRNGK